MGSGMSRSMSSTAGASSDFAPVCVSNKGRDESPKYEI
jgi:hypothetical protein